MSPLLGPALRTWTVKQMYWRITKTQTLLTPEISKAVVLKQMMAELETTEAPAMKLKTACQLPMSSAPLGMG